jgi:hypothetical protein
MGITHSMTIMLQNRGVSYAEQSIFYLSHYPFTCEDCDHTTSLAIA